QLFRQPDFLCPVPELLLHELRQPLATAKEHIELWTDADSVVGDGQPDALGIAVVLDLVAATIGEPTADFRLTGSVGAQRVRVCPVPTVFVRGLRGVIPPPDGAGTLNRDDHATIAR